MIAKMKKIGSRFPSVITLVVVRTTKKIVGPPDPLSWWSCGPLLIKVCVKPWLRFDFLGFSFDDKLQIFDSFILSTKRHNWSKVHVTVHYSRKFHRALYFKVF